MSAESTISVSTPVMTLINMFTVEPARQQELVQLLVTATEEVIQHQPGFVSANIHASADGGRVVNYAQWESEQAFRAMLANPQAREHMAAATRFAHAEPHLYDVASVHHR
ncbi:MAG TPA: antibiotic biosynthesis monooxygenase family protein [Pseudonocardiaceae bacterium]|nr:antibiotic biosynthesis monooxygenase family protein [Pseudonocardiaceae bacterium]